MTEKIVPGQIVRSKAGRDKYRHHVIVEVIDNEYVTIADGKTRKIERPKKKKLKHLAVLNDNAFADEEFSFTNNKLKKVTQRYNEGDK